MRRRAGLPVDPGASPTAALFTAPAWAGSVIVHHREALALLGGGRSAKRLPQQSMGSGLGDTTGYDALEPDGPKGEGQWIGAMGFGGFRPLGSRIKTCVRS
jgi:hypothetical protein